MRVDESSTHPYLGPVATAPSADRLSTIDAPAHPSFMTKTLLLLAAVVALLTLGSLWAERQVDAGASAVAPEAKNGGVPLPSLRMAARPGSVVLTGRLPDEAERAAILRRAKALYGAERVVDHMQTGGVANPSWLTAAFLPDLRPAMQATAVLEDARLVIDGVVDTPQALDAVARSVAPFRAQGLEVINRIAVQAPHHATGS